MLSLSATHLINRGANRDCYRHPDDPSRCIKLNRLDGRGKHKGMNEVEYEYHTALAKRVGEAFYRHAPKCFGTVETNLGVGLCFELVRDADGRCSTRLQNYIKDSGCSPKRVQDLIDPLEHFVKGNQIALFDANFHNLLVRIGADGREDLVVIDWKGPKALHEFIPLSRMIPLVCRMKTARRFNRLRERVEQLLAMDSQTHTTKP